MRTSKGQGLDRSTPVCCWVVRLTIGDAGDAPLCELFEEGSTIRRDVHVRIVEALEREREMRWAWRIPSLCHHCAIHHFAITTLQHQCVCHYCTLTVPFLCTCNHTLPCAIHHEPFSLTTGLQILQGFFVTASDKNVLNIKLRRCHMISVNIK